MLAHTDKYPVEKKRAVVYFTFQLPKGAKEGEYKVDVYMYDRLLKDMKIDVKKP